MDAVQAHFIATLFDLPTIFTAITAYRVRSFATAFVWALIFAVCGEILTASLNSTNVFGDVLPYRMLSQIFVAGIMFAMGSNARKNKADSEEASMDGTNEDDEQGDVLPDERSPALTKQPESTGMALSRVIKICMGAGIGGLIGSSFGVAGFGTATVATIPLAALGAYIAHLLTSSKDSAGEVDTSRTPEYAFKEIESVAADAAPIIVRFLNAAWNLLMKTLLMLGLMPAAKKAPWLLVVLMLGLMVVMPILAILFIGMGAAALNAKVKGDNDFMILPEPPQDTAA